MYRPFAAGLDEQLARRAELPADRVDYAVIRQAHRHGIKVAAHVFYLEDAKRLARLDLPVGACVQGPAILEQHDTTVWMEPGFEAHVDDFGNLCVKQLEQPI